MNIAVRDPMHAPAAPAPAAAPKVAVVMAAHNADRTIRQAVDSLLTGTLPCRIIIVDDASLVPVENVLAGVDPKRVEILRVTRNAGPAAARNVAIERAMAEGYPFIAVMDADDVAHPERLARQVEFLETYPQIGLVGSWVRLINENGDVLGQSQLPCTPQDIRERLPIRMCMSHPTWLARAEVFATVGAYSRAYAVAEDYEILRRIAAHYEVACLPAYLLDYRLSSGGITSKRRNRELMNRVRIQLQYFKPDDWRCWLGILRTLALMVVRVQVDTQFPGKLAAG